MSATFTTANGNQAIAVTLDVSDDSSKFDSYTTKTKGTISASWNWDACCTDGLAFTIPNAQNSSFCISVDIPKVKGISQLYASSQNLFGEQDLEYVPLSDRSTLEICGATCTDPCGQYYTCDTCQNNLQCGWCADSGTCELGTPGGPSTGRCALWRYNFTQSRVVTADPSYPIDPSDIQVYMGAKDLAANFYVNIPSPANIPLDVLIVQELTSGFIYDLISLKTVLPQVIDSIRSTYSNSRFGFATFSDKPIYPYGVSGKDWVFSLTSQLTSDVSSVKQAITGINTCLNGGDAPNAQLEALLLAAGSNVGWAENSRHVVLLITKSTYHTPTGLFPPNIGNGFSVSTSNQDYPTTNLVYSTLLANNIVPIILTTDSLSQNIYGPLISSWGFGTTLTYSLYSMPSQVNAALTEIGGSVSAFIQTAGRVTAVSAPYSGVSSLSRVYFTATVSAASTSTDTAVIVVPGFGQITIATLATDAPVTLSCGSEAILCTDTATFTLRGISAVYGDTVTAQITSVPGNFIIYFMFLTLSAVGVLYQYGTTIEIQNGDFVTDPGLQVVYDPQGNCGSVNYTQTFSYRIFDSCEVCSTVDTCGVTVIGTEIPPVATPSGPLLAPINGQSVPYPLNGTGIGSLFFFDF
jgi:hypothetical protein